MDLQLKGRRALITGASKGIGREIAFVLAEEGCLLHLAARGAADLNSVSAEIAARGYPLPKTHACDLAARGAAVTLAAACGELDILINNAGAIPRGNLDEIDEDRWRSAWALKVYGTIDLSRAVLSGMRDRKNGAIVNVIGLAGDRPSAEYVVGSAGNAALMAFTRAVGGNSIDDGVRIVGVNPGLVKTERLEAVLRQQAQQRFGDPERWRECQDASKLPAGRAADPREIADVVAFLASSRASYMSGTIVAVDGGRSYRP
ncbi:short-chain dehydrogenase/reductase [Pseudacidovorax sp. RU35E]|jgi:NAD(P)-dependent dehydrogenase (short-subunit alcohol dehydrogenase family)|uniref:short-chain dehydrogenase/reductase n=1 Tax=Pseudacidovorax sp. RU35E TaxID=1907403 RepID=UPI000955B272|nr:short-chain dehydrogenase/reductase [Pseudacidovorax sp. RU35E]SIR76494.1 NADP-dependent 3-hydroxy acid dehydrogenase YdfG [Pseudacidovorax sp. RU35E]